MIAERLCPVRWISVVLWCSVLATHHVWPISRTSAQLVPATFCFGDSLADPGNNNYINSLSKADYPFNGIDFAAGPTGRFTNGRTTVDIIGTVLLLAALLRYLNGNKFPQKSIPSFHQLIVTGSS
jgi:hypothetical protein